MLIEERFTVKAPVNKVWDFLMDINSLSKCIPGCEEVETIDDKTVVGKVKIKVGFISASFKIKTVITEINPPFSLRSLSTGEDSKIASNVRSKNTLELKSLSENETELYYSSDVNLFGTIGNLGQGIVREKAKELGKKFADVFKSRLESA